MGYKSLYTELASALDHLGVAVCDHDYMGYCFQTLGLRGFIYIKSRLTYKEKYMALCHETGHLFYMKKGKTLNWSKKPRTEEQANWFAMQLLRRNGIDVEEYKEFYNKALVAVKKRKKSWFEI